MAQAKPNIDPKQIVNLSGKKFIQYPGLVELAHQQGVKSIAVDLVQLPTKDNGEEAIFRAEVVMEDGSTFSDFGDASPRSVKPGMAPHIIRMAATRAKARALRDATNCAITAWEELEEGGEKPAEQQQAPAPKEKAPADPKAEALETLKTIAWEAAKAAKIDKDDFPTAMKAALLAECGVDDAKLADPAQLHDLAKKIQKDPKYLPTLLMKGAA